MTGITWLNWAEIITTLKLMDSIDQTVWLRFWNYDWRSYLCLDQQSWTSPNFSTNLISLNYIDQIVKPLCFISSVWVQFSIFLSLHRTAKFIDDHVVEFCQSVSVSETFFQCGSFGFFRHFFLVFLQYFFRILLSCHSTSTFPFITFNNLPFSIYIVLAL